MQREQFYVTQWVSRLRQFFSVQAVTTTFCMTGLMCGILAALPSPGAVAADTTAAPDEVIKIRMLRKKECEPCDRAHTFLKKVAAKDEWLIVQAMDMETSSSAKDIYERFLELFEVSSLEFPITIIGTHAVTGYVDDETTGMEILGTAQYCRWFGCEDVMEALGQNGKTVLEVKILKPTFSRSRVKTAMSNLEHCIADRE